MDIPFRKKTKMNPPTPSQNLSYTITHQDIDNTYVVVQNNNPTTSAVYNTLQEALDAIRLGFSHSIKPKIQH